MRYRVGIDVGGTFTDFLLVDQENNSKIYKTLSTPQDPTIGFFNGLKEMAKDHYVSLDEFIKQIELIVHGTTVGTNAALTYSGAKTALITTKGFRDILEMRRGIRPNAYDNEYIPPEPYVERKHRYGVEERVTYTGEEVTSFNENQALQILEKMSQEGMEAVAVCFMHSYANPAHEKKMEELINKKLPGVYVTVSSDLVPRARLYDRVSTTVLNSYVGPIIEGYFKKLTEELEDKLFRGTLLIMQSNGGVATPNITIEKAANTLLSGPAAAPIAGSWYLKSYGIHNAITMDMGGTSFDIALIKDGNPLLRTEGEIADWPINLPIVDVHTIGAGGGSIAWVDDGGLLHIGPKSAGANPGPACYGFGGEQPTVTDANLVLGYLNPDYFLGGKMSLNKELAYNAIKTYVADKLGIDVLSAAKGIIEMANVNMANGIREITVKRGYDPREFPLVCAGGAGPLHATAIAQELDCSLVIVPKESSIFCAAGMLMSDLRHDFVKAHRILTKDLEVDTINGIFNPLKVDGRTTLLSEGVPEEKINFEYSFDMMYAGQYYELTIPFNESEMENISTDQIESKFHLIHEQLFGYSTAEMPVEVINFNLSALGLTVKPGLNKTERKGDSPVDALKGTRLAQLGSKKGQAEVPVYDGHILSHGNHVVGPAIIEQVVTTVIVPEDFNVICDKHENYVMYRKNRPPENVSNFVEEVGGVKR